MNYDGKHALVLGLGETGLAMAQWLARCGARVRVADTRQEPQRLQALRDAVPGVEFAGAPFNIALLDTIDFVAVSPGLMPERELAEIGPEAGVRSIPLWSEIELFAQALAALKVERGYAPKVIAITGTNGKTTVTSLTGLLCERAGLRTRVAGNISPAALDVLREVLDAAVDGEPLPQAWILELSSFQLHATFSLQADAATVLNLSQDHLDWHGDMAAYGADKARIFGANTVRVLNRDDQAVMQMASATGNNVTFGTNEPDAAGSFGLQSERGVLWLAVALAGEESEKKRKKNEAPEVVPSTISRLMPADALRIRGLHNAANALAALALCRAIGLPFAPLLHGLRDYHGEPHRVELVAAIEGIDYYDDSKGTNVGATVAALNGLGKAFAGAQSGGQSGTTQRIVLIAGGDGKGQDFSPLAEPCSRYVRAIVLIGRDAPKLRAAIEEAGVDMFDCATLPEAVEKAASLALTGDAVLLSPACASMDMFTNYAHRAQVFCGAVRELALAKGQDI
ncbi:UDP-N-acetylmuramoyl-L-alanine--D-glutamate ligase [Massilia sp. TWP1-3-3]|uniref:UDP-N-acetylmuramoyl-L-alanine--D-glutamate ligase n=1 Tax=Massilia sp. TWP1-3-3 TaxID=2804573 RepID=UPI003CECABB2